MIRVYLFVEGPTDAEFLRRILPPGVLKLAGHRLPSPDYSTRLVPTNERSPAEKTIVNAWQFSMPSN